MDALIKARDGPFNMEDIVVEYQHDKGGIIVANKEARYENSDHRGFPATEAEVSAGGAIRTKVQRGASYGRRDSRIELPVSSLSPEPNHTETSLTVPNGNIEDSPRKRLERLLRTPTLDLVTSREIEPPMPHLPNRSRSMSPPDMATLQMPRPAAVRKSETIRNALNHVSDGQRTREKSLAAFNLPGIMFQNGHTGNGLKGGPELDGEFEDTLNGHDEHSGGHLGSGGDEVGGGGGSGSGGRGGGSGGDEVIDISRPLGLYQSKLERDFDVNKELLEIAESGDHVRLEEFLKVQAGVVDANYKQLYKYHAYYPDILIPDAKTPLTCAVRSQSLQCVELLIKDGAKVTTNHKEILYDPDHALSLSPLAASVKLKHRKIAEFLVEKGADIRITFILLSNVFDPFLFKIFEASNIEQLSPSSSLSRSKPPDLDGLKELIHPDILCAWPSPIDIAFKVSKAFEFLKGIKEEYRKDFAALAAQCDKFAYDFLSQCQTPNEARDLLGRAGFLDEAMDANKKDFVAHPLSQQLLKMEWQKGDATYLSTANFNGWFYAFLRVLVLPCIVPFAFLQFMLSNESIKKSNVARMTEVINVPVYCFMVHATSSCLFLVIILWICNTATEPFINAQEYILWTFVLGRVLVETQQIQRTRMTEYLSSMWNIVDIISLILFVAIIVMRISFYFAFHYFKGTLVLPDPIPDITVYNYFEKVSQKSSDGRGKLLSGIAVPTIGSYSENELLAVINIIYSINSIIACTRLLPLFEASYSLGPLQLTMGGMLADLSKVMCLLFTVILAFSLGIAKLYNSRYFYLFVNGKNLTDKPEVYDSEEARNAWRSILCLYSEDNTVKDPDSRECGFNGEMIVPELFKSFTMTFVTLFWSLFGLIVPDNIQSTDGTSEYLGKIYFGAYMIIAAILLINILIAMINNTYKKVIDNSDVEWKFARASLVQEFKEAHPIIPPFNLITVFFTMITKFFILNCGSERAKRAIEHLLIVSGAESEDNVRERNEMASNKSNKAYPSSSKLSDADKSSEKIDVDVFEQPKVDILQQVLIRMLVKRYKKSGMSRKMQRMVIAVVGDEVMTLPATGDVDEEVEDDIKELKVKMDMATKQLEMLSEDVGKKLLLISEKLNSIAGARSVTPPLLTTTVPRKLPLPRNNRPRSNNM